MGNAIEKKVDGLPGIDRRIRVMVVDDSVVVRRLIMRVLEEDPLIEVVGAASNGAVALKKIPELKPDILTLDIEMPEMDGLETLMHLRQAHPGLRVIMFSTLTERGARATIDSLLRGASEYVTKPSNTGQMEESIERLRHFLLPKLKQFYIRASEAVAQPHVLPASNRVTDASVSVAKPKAQPAMANRSAAIKANGALPIRPRARRFRLVAIGVSTGGPTALTELLPTIPADFPLPIAIVQHMPPMFTQFLAERLDAKSLIHVVEAQDGMVIEAGTAYLAPGDYHMRFEKKAGQTRVVLDQGPAENSCRPAVDAMLRSAAEVFEGDVLVAILTGMGHDGRIGAAEIKRRGGYVIAQDAESSVVWGMPGAVVEAGLADQVTGLGTMGANIVSEVGKA